MKKVISIVGARPQFIKLSALSRVLRESFNEVIVHTGQHFDENMSAVFFKELGMKKPKYNLGVGSNSHGKQTAEMLEKLEECISTEKPDLVIVFGDTNSTLAGVLATSKLNIKTVHVEAGLRSFNREMPEEVNRIAADHLSDFLFAPTDLAILNLAKEGLSEKSYLTGDIMVDSVLNNVILAEKKSQVLSGLNLVSKEYYLATLHRPYNVDNPTALKNILSELNKLEHKVVFPIHPRTRKNIERYKLKIGDNIMIVSPLGYLDFLSLMKHSYKIITDSGGIQKEAFILKKPCITLRTETEWVETVDSGWNLLVTDSEKTMFSSRILSFHPSGTPDNIYGENVSGKMFKLIKDLL